MRGRGRGRGRGRFGRGGFPSFSRENSDDAEYPLDQDEDEHPPLYPPIALPEPIQISTENKFCISKSRELSKRMRSLPYFSIVNDQDEADVLGYSAKIQRLDNKQDLQNVVDISDSSLIPQELLVDFKRSSGKNRGTKTSSGASSNRNVDKDGKVLSLFEKLENLEKNLKEGSGGTAATRQQSTETNKDNLSEAEFDENEANEMDDGDYIVDYYASDNEEGVYGDDGGGGEATF